MEGCKLHITLTASISVAEKIKDPENYANSAQCKVKHPTWLLTYLKSRHGKVSLSLLSFLLLGPIHSSLFPTDKMAGLLTMSRSTIVLLGLPGA